MPNREKSQNRTLPAMEPKRGGTPVAFDCQSDITLLLENVNGGRLQLGNDNAFPPSEPQSSSPLLLALYDGRNPFWKRILAKKVPANDVDDVAQQAATTLYIRRASIVPGKEKAFARGVVRNLLGSLYRQQRKREVVTADLDDTPNDYDVDVLVDTHRTLRRVVEAVEQMSESDRAALTYSREDRDVDDIGFLPAVSVSATTEWIALKGAAARQQKHRAIGRLKTMLQPRRRLKHAPAASGDRGKKVRRP